MHEFRLSAFPRFAQGSSGDAIAAVSAPTISACFSAMSAEVAKWLPGAVKCDGGGRLPQAIELTLEWSDAAAGASAPERPGAPSDPTRCTPRSPTPHLRQALHRRIGRACSAAPCVRTRGPGRLLRAGR